MELMIEPAYVRNLHEPQWPEGRGASGHAGTWEVALPWAPPCASLLLLVHLGPFSYPFLIRPQRKYVFLTSVMPSTKLIDLRRGHENLHLVRSTGDRPPGRVTGF